MSANLSTVRAGVATVLIGVAVNSRSHVIKTARAANVRRVNG